MLRFGLGLAACAAAVCACQSAFAGSSSPKGDWPVLVLAANASNSSIAVSKTKKAPRAAEPQAKEPLPPLPEKKDAKAAPAPAWKPEEIAAAQARCAAILKDIDAVSEPQPPIREGQCGAPAPIRLKSVGKNPQVTFDPPALVNCELAGAIAGWIKNDVQPAALKHLGAKIAKLEIMSDYSCRTSAGRGPKHLSEHAFANALDIGAFVTEKGKSTSVLEGWGTPKREIAERIAAEKAKAEQEAAARTAADAKAQENLKDPAAKSGGEKPAPVAVASNLGTPGTGTAKTVRSKGTDKLVITLPGSAKAPNDDLTKLGGPTNPAARKSGNPADVAALSVVEPPPGPQAQFLHEIHASACRLFGTTLGPEANADHRNHFHVDMAERKYKKICD
jgi:hypothetical protein